VIDRLRLALLEYGLFNRQLIPLLAPKNIEELVVSLVKIIVITIIVILSILLFGRFFV
jgi:hypothetical protein